MLAAVVVVAGGCAVVRVSVSSSGTEGSQESWLVKGLTDDGRYTLFVSDADNLVANDTNFAPDLFRHDTTTRETVRVDVATNGGQLTGGALDGALSADGRYAAFGTDVGLDPGDTNGRRDVYVRDLTGGTTSWASRPPPGGLPAGGVPSGAIAISADARYVSFVWASDSSGGMPGTQRLYRRDRNAGTTVPLSAPTSFDTRLYASDDGHHFASREGCSSSANCDPRPLLIDADGSGAGWPTLPYGRCTNALVRAMSAGGRFLVWESGGAIPAPCLGRGTYLVDRATGTASLLDTNDEWYEGIGVSRDGRSVLFLGLGNILPNGTPGRIDLYRRDVAAGTDLRVGLSVAVQEPDADVNSGALSSDGHWIAFVTAAGNVVPDDHNNTRDVFVRPIVSPSG
jgi:Tol biopolymer transport system component